MNQREKLNLLSEKSRTENQARLSSDIQFKDEANHLSTEQQMAWAKLISSVATVEGVENTVMAPIGRKFIHDFELSEYVRLHAEDEHRHAELFRSYVKSTFHYEKKKRSLTDKLIYDRALPLASQKLGNRPVAFLSAVLFFEKYSAYFYGELKRCAIQDRLPGLVQLIQSIEKDELRHVVGIESLLQLYQQDVQKIDWIDLITTRSLIRLLLLDVDQRATAFYNRHVRENLQLIGIDPDRLTQMGNQSATNTIQYLKETSQGVGK